MDSKYEVLIRALDSINNEAPDAFKKLHSTVDNLEGIRLARSKAFIHLFLKVQFGILNFEDRNDYITDGVNDGGIDGYYIDQENWTIYFIQSKFRNTEVNFHEKEILFGELLKMDIKEIVEGEQADINGDPYNTKIRSMQTKIADLSQLPRYNFKVVILANIKNNDLNTIKRAIGGYDIVLYDFNRTYNTLVFPLITSTFYNQENLIITLEVSDKSQNPAEYFIETSYKPCAVTILLIPVKEIGRILHCYKNSILKYNPRSYLTLQNNDVNVAIHNTITNVSSNDFALLNNGVTILAKETKYTKNTAKQGQAQLMMTNPQMINGGQTAYTLSTIYEDCKKNDDFSVMEGKSIVLRVISLDVSENEKLGLQLVEKISMATNFQTPVGIHDRISNDEIQILLQKEIFEKYGYYYERKRGEYAEGLTKNYITKDMIISKIEFMRVFLCSIRRPSEARRISLKLLFSKNFLDRIEISQVQKYFYSYKSYEYVQNFTKQSKKYNWYLDKYGNALRYGNYAVVTASIISSISLDLSNINSEVDNVLQKWIDFENFIVKQTDNERYIEEREDEFGNVIQIVNFNGYYRGITLNKDIYSFFKKK